MTPGAADIGQLVGQLLAELDLRAKPAAAGPADELSELLAIPWRDWELDPTRRSSLTESGAPFELSVKLDGGQGISLRYVVDVADRRLDLSANAATYLTAVERTGQTAAAALFDRYLASTPVGAPARVMVGVGFAGGGRRRATVYFPASWLPVGTLGEMLPDGALGAAETEQAIVDPAVEVIGYDVVDGRLATCKTYRWLAVGPDLPMPVGVGDPAEGPARIVREFVVDVPAELRARSTFLQRTVRWDGPAAPSEKLFFFSRGWGWSSGPGLARLFAFLVGELGVDLRPLVTIREASGRFGLPLHIGLVAVGGSAISPTVTCYFWPVGH